MPIPILGEFLTPWILCILYIWPTTEWVWSVVVPLRSILLINRKIAMRRSGSNQRTSVEFLIRALRSAISTIGEKLYLQFILCASSSEERNVLKYFKVRVFSMFFLLCYYSFDISCSTLSCTMQVLKTTYVS